jgi:cytochrome P450 monooxygenase
MLSDEAHSCEPPASPAELKSFPVAEALFREVLRLYPPLSLTTRETTDAISIAGHSIPRGTVLGIPLGALARDPELFPDPDRFDLSRWFGRKTPPSPIELAPFGGGPHFCLGYHLAWMESVLFIVSLVKQMQARRLRPRLVSRSKPRQVFLPLGHPSGGTQVLFA